MRAALYVTIWASMAALVAAEWARRRATRVGPLTPLAASTLGLLAIVVHIAIAIFHHHGGSHAEAVAATAALTEAVYGVAWGGGVYVNYAFVAIWMGYLWWWRAAPSRAIAHRHPAVVAIRLLLFVFLVNALVVFASPLTRPLGLALCATLLWAWRPVPDRASREPRRHGDLAAESERVVLR